TELYSHAVAIAQELAAAEGVELKPVNFSNGWDEKLQLALDAAKQPGAKSPSVVWSMFGTFTTSEVKQLHAAGVEAWTTVTTEHEARAAVAAGVDALCVQGPEAGGHRGVWNPTAEPDKRPLPELIDAIAALTDLPLIAAGGLRSADDVHAALGLPGVKARACRPAILVTAEAGARGLRRAGTARGRGEG